MPRMRKPRTASVGLILVVLMAMASTSPAGEPAKDLKDPDAKVRLAAVDTLRTTATPEAEALLVSALEDKDGEVAERALKALAERTGDAALKALADACLNAPARRTRLSAARALSIHPRFAEGTLLLVKAPGSALAAACEAGAVIADIAEDEGVRQLANRGFNVSAKKDQAPRAAAARCIGAFPADERAKLFAKLAVDEDVNVAAAAAEAVRCKPNAATTPVIIDLLSKPKPAPAHSVERRLAAAFLSAVAAEKTPEDAMKVAQRALDALATTAAAPAKAGDALPAGASPEAAVRLLHVIASLGSLPDDRISKPDLFKGLAAAIRNPNPKVRAAAAFACGRLGIDAAADAATTIAKEDTDARVRLVALLAVASVRPAEKHDGAFRLFLDRLQYDTDPLVREEAGVALGRRGLQGVILSLQKSIERALAKKDGSEWALGTVCLVSAGKTRDPAAVPVLTDTLAKAKDWRLRAAAVMGLGHVQDLAAIPPVIEALADKDPNVSMTAYEVLRRLTTERIDPKRNDWKAWWDKNGGGFRWIDREEEAKKAQKYGYAPDVKGVYEGLDVLVLDTRVGGDRIQEILTDLKIEHRITRAGSVPKSGLHPYGLFVANCPGELNPDDVEPIAWFVRAGGYLFASCWSVHETIEKVYPGVLRKFPINGQVIDNVETEPAALQSPFIDGVFKDLVRPVYCLEGAHLIDVLDRERAEVLMDSPWTEEKYGCGNMAAWFRAGHGLILDSANHFEEQGLAKVTTVRTPEERIAYAVDHLGLSWPEIRAIDSKAWKTPQDAGKEAKDLSCFRLITNFVRAKRKSQE